MKDTSKETRERENAIWKGRDIKHMEERQRMMEERIFEKLTCIQLEFQKDRIERMREVISEGIIDKEF